jgi:very-short-patch-repair endonuclease
MTTARKKLSLGNVTDRAEDREVGGDRTRAWTVSPARAEQLKQRARDMRRNPTEAQQALWERLKDKQCGFTFNREVVMGSAIVDFACKTRWLVVETGGDSESETTLAALSDRKLTDVGVRVLRFADDAVLADTDAVVKAIKDELQKPFEKPKIGTSNAQDR